MEPHDLINGILARSHPSEELVYDFVAGRLSDAQSELVVEHLARCRHCREIAKMLGWSPEQLQSAKVYQFQAKSSSEPAESETDTLDTAATASFSEKLAALDDEAATASEEIAGNSEFIQRIPSASDGNAVLGYVSNRGTDIVVVTGAGDCDAKVVLGGIEYEVRSGPANQPRIVEGLDRQSITLWLARGRPSGFSLVCL